MKKGIAILLSITLLCMLGSCSSAKPETEMASSSLKKIETVHRAQWWLGAIGWDVAERNENLTGKGVTIALIDTGVDARHPDFANANIEEYHVVEAVQDDHGEHGTAVAGIICATPHNAEGVLGIAADVKLLSIDISNAETAKPEDLAKGIEYAVSQDVDIINISAGIIENNEEVAKAIDRAYEKGIVIVAASGNDYGGSTLYPARYENVLSVNALDANGQKLFDDDNEKSIDVPGGNIVTTYSSATESKKYASYTGTSVAAPIVSGTVALALQANPNLTNRDIYGYFHGNSAQFNVKTVLNDLKNIQQGGAEK